MTVTRSDLESMGRLLRDQVSRKDHGKLQVPDRDPVAILTGQNDSRLQHLVPVRFGRMLQSPFSYYRGTAAVMAHDLAADTATGIHVVSCGDAHISNFGLYASPERRLVFDLNDFDESGLGPWEWDLKRLAASVVIGGRDAGYTGEENRTAARYASQRYREALAEFLELSSLERYFFQVDYEAILDAAGDKETKKLVTKTVKKAKNRTSDRVLQRSVTVTPEGTLAIVEQPPVTEKVDHGDEERLATLWEQYRSTLRPDAALLLSGFRLVDYALRVVGVGSVGTRCYILLFSGPSGEPLFLQAKEANRSVLETHGGIEKILPDSIPAADHGHEGYRVVACQRILQAQSDPFLGWIEGFAGESDGSEPVDYYWRQFRDMKGSIDIAGLNADQFKGYSGLCATLLARAHSQSPMAAAISAYLGNSERFDQAISDWAEAYADQAERDFEQLEQAAKTGQIPVEYDV